MKHINNHFIKKMKYTANNTYQTCLFIYFSVTCVPDMNRNHGRSIPAPSSFESFPFHKVMYQIMTHYCSKYITYSFNVYKTLPIVWIL